MATATRVIQKKFLFMINWDQHSCQEWQKPFSINSTSLVPTTSEIQAIIILQNSKRHETLLL